MKWKLAAALFFVVMSFAVLNADPGSFGIGLIIGEPTGISAKYYFDQNKAVDAAAGWSVVKSVARVHADFLFHNRKFMDEKLSLPLTLYYGAGLKSIFGDDFELGIRIPVGVLHDFRKTELDAFLEIVPGMLLTPETKLTLDAAFGGRYYFGRK